MAIGDISIHALVKRATGLLWQAWKAKNHFNPRPREEGDSFLRYIGIISSHFNPRPREEGDLALRGNGARLFLFQSTPS